MKMPPAKIREMLLERAAFQKRPAAERFHMAKHAQNSRRSRQFPLDRLRVTVIKAQGKQLLVLRAGNKFVSSFTWDTLLMKACLQGWKRLNSTLEKRFANSGLPK